MEDSKKTISADARRTVTVEEAAEMVGISRTTAYETLRIDGAILGVQPLRVGRRVLIPRAALLRALGE